jgi:hypothetical protein
MQPHILAHFVDARRPLRLSFGGACRENNQRSDRQLSRVEPCHFTVLLVAPHR